MELNECEQRLMALVRERKLLSIRELSCEDIQAAEGLANRGILQKISTSLNSFYYVEIIESRPQIVAVLPPYPTLNFSTFK